jgi:hypothetical protein
MRIGWVLVAIAAFIFLTYGVVNAINYSPPVDKNYTCGPSGHGICNTLSQPTP